VHGTWTYFKRRLAQPRALDMVMRVRPVLYALALALALPCALAIGHCTSACKARKLYGFVKRAPANDSYPSHLLEPTHESGPAMVVPPAVALCNGRSAASEACKAFLHAVVQSVRCSG